jgi:Ca2+-transporting ATPase
MIWFFAATSSLYAGVGRIAEAVTLLLAIGPIELMDVFLHRRTQASTEGGGPASTASPTAAMSGAALAMSAAHRTGQYVKTNPAWTR